MASSKRPRRPRVDYALLNGQQGFDSDGFQMVPPGSPAALSSRAASRESTKRAAQEPKKRNTSARAQVAAASAATSATAAAPASDKAVASRWDRLKGKLRSQLQS